MVRRKEQRCRLQWGLLLVLLMVVVHLQWALWRSRCWCGDGCGLRCICCWILLQLQRRLHAVPLPLVATVLTALPTSIAAILAADTGTAMRASVADIQLRAVPVRGATVRLAHRVVLHAAGTLP